MTCPACESAETLTIEGGIAKCQCGARWNTGVMLYQPVIPDTNT